ncbi:cardiolipin synthase [Salibacterium salarium]|uniref:Cardiolipin synthase n=1 Tax=Salibacterium salarium TaxID=284579 RepID=A0A428MWE7_9BACI|nr:cardiolipin synthase [Salibacterium salarium]RSL30468.1 cardiolipin synthase [Salibacterium salarium]
MVIIFNIFLLLFIIYFWLRLDFLLGEKNHILQQETNPVIYPDRCSNVAWFDTGEDFYQAFFEDIQSASDHVHVLFYIFRNDSIGSQLIDLLIEKASEGVTVRVLIDRISGGMNREGRNRLKNAGIHFSYSQKIKFPYLFYSLNRRNHRKITIIDGKIGYIGGFNIGDEYLGRDPKLGFWRDFHLRFDGEGVQDLQAQFLQDWSREHNQDTYRQERYYPKVAQGKQRTHFASTDAKGLEESFAEAIQQANHYIYIASPYFIPGSVIQDTLLTSLNRGVDITILLPEKRDHPLVKEASFSYLEELLHAGAKVYHFQDGFYHAKALLIDDSYCDVGSANFDLRSFHLNNEMNTLISDSTLFHTVKDAIEEDMKRSTRLTIKDLKDRPFSIRFREKIASSIEKLL